VCFKVEGGELVTNPMGGELVTNPMGGELVTNPMGGGPTSAAAEGAAGL
jgi:hypothetical protein